MRLVGESKRRSKCCRYLRKQATQIGSALFYCLSSVEEEREQSVKNLEAEPSASGDPCDEREALVRFCFVLKVRPRTIVRLTQAQKAALAEKEVVEAEATLQSAKTALAEAENDAQQAHTDATKVPNDVHCSLNAWCSSSL